MGKSRANRKVNRFAHNAVSVITAFSLLFLQTPVSYAAPQAADDASPVVATQSDAASELKDAAKASAESASKAAAEKQEASKGAADKSAESEPKGAAADGVSDASKASAAKASSETEQAKDAKASDDAASEAAERSDADKPHDAAGADAQGAAAQDDEPAADGDETEADGAADDESQDAADADAVASDEAADAGELAADAAEEEPAAKRVYTFEDAAVKVTATLQKADAIPDDAELKVTAVTPQTRGYNYDAYMEALNKDAGEQDAYTAENTLLYDVAFLAKSADGNVVELQPESGSVKVAFEFKKAQLSEGIGADADSLQVVHLPLKDAAKQDAATTKDATQIAAEDVKADALDADEFSMPAANAVELKADGFSVFAFYTVDFTHDGYTYSIAGESEIMLSALFDALNIDEDVADVENATFSNPELVSVVKEGADWKLTSLKPFQSEETLTVEMKSGVTYVIAVTDAANSPSTFDIAVNFYDYADANSLGSIPTGLASGEQWYLLVWSSDKEIGQADTASPWYIEQLTEFEGKATPFEKHIEKFSTTSSYNNNALPYADMTAEQKKNLQVRIVHSNTQVSSLDGVIQLATRSWGQDIY